MKNIKKHPKATEALEFLAKYGTGLKFYCENGYQISKSGNCTCRCDNSKMKQARKVKINKLKEYGLLFTKNYKVTSCAAAKQ